jgi:hypothetical protein
MKKRLPLEASHFVDLENQLVSPKMTRHNTHSLVSISPIANFFLKAKKRYIHDVFQIV